MYMVIFLLVPSPPLLFLGAHIRAINLFMCFLSSVMMGGFLMRVLRTILVNSRVGGNPIITYAHLV